jgi:hypothetical protein
MAVPHLSPRYMKQRSTVTDWGRSKTSSPVLPFTEHAFSVRRVGVHFPYCSRVVTDIAGVKNRECCENQHREGQARCKGGG